MTKQDLTRQASEQEAFFHSPGTFVHPTAMLGPDVVLEFGAKIGAYVTITGKVRIGSRTKIYPYVSIGYPAQARGVLTPLGHVNIGTDCEIREFASIHAPRDEGGATIVGNHCYIMNYAHISHNCILEDYVTLTNNVQLGGHTHLEHHVLMMASAATHQFCRVGQYTAVAPFSATRQDLPPFCMFSWQPAAYYGLNRVGLQRAGFSAEAINAIKRVSTHFYRDKLSLSALETFVEGDTFLAGQEAVLQFVQFIKQSSRGVSRRALGGSSTHEEAS